MSEYNSIEKLKDGSFVLNSGGCGCCVEMAYYPEGRKTYRATVTDIREFKEYLREQMALADELLERMTSDG